MSKRFFSTVLAACLLSATVAVQAATYEYSNITEEFEFSNVLDTWTGEFWVNNSVDAGPVIIYTDSAVTDQNPMGSFFTLIVVWDADGNKVGTSEFWDLNRYQPDRNAYFEMNLGDGYYTFTLLNWPNAPAGNHISDGFVTPAGLDTSVIYPNTGYGQWHVVVSGVVPEPETWAMLLAGLAMVGSVARRRRLHVR